VTCPQNSFKGPFNGIGFQIRLALLNREIMKQQGRRTSSPRDNVLSPDPGRRYVDVNSPLHVDGIALLSSGDRLKINFALF
jgi:hypothetical protein